ncbi:hypothetical protein FP2506_11422 [Fulvimarina pelagi HTCC2506]|uniref:Helix-hairpin-helix domain-containing protein n=1 Tax=Fulvimarina pelagi HTCC2506 TaxID=314231 RepID=Q0FYZ5_9HYPH|nr:helix-hairpin-helix domain-containing protein [Fulvimarina pelagi]EAU40163.1 hypothetical protein FP2506_11422 [Fulvimarina pelagi HTCC2506]
MDDLTRIKGIGTATASKLAAADLGSFAALAAVEDLAKLAGISTGEEQSRAWIEEAGKIEAAAAPGPAPAEGGPVKVTEARATELVRDKVETNTDSAGRTSSAELRQERLDPIRHPAAAASVRTTGEAYGGTLPATTRVMAGGRTVSLSAQSEDKSEKIFTAATRILRSKALYEPGASIPLTRAEFRSKSGKGAIAERDWDDGGLVDIEAA